MQENRVSIKISPADLQKALDAINVISNTLKPYLVALTPDDRHNLPKVSDGTLPFVQKTLDYAGTNGGFMPAYIDVGELKVDVDATDVLLQIQRPLGQLAQNLDDTIMLCGSEAYIAAVAFYNSVKLASKLKVPGAEPIANDLGVRFAAQGKRTIKPATVAKPTT